MNMIYHIKIKILLSTSILLSSINYNSLCQDWDLTGELPQTIRYEDVFFVDPMVGWTVSSGGKIFKTTNAGDSWTHIYQTGNYLRSIEFINESIGFVGSLDGVFLRTPDGGQTWSHIEDSVPETIEGICGLSHVGNIVFGVGIWSGPAFFIKSEDQGLTWTYTDMSAYADGLVDCHFVNEDIGFVSGITEDTYGVVLKTTDGGISWKPVFNSIGHMEYVWKMFFVNDSVAYGSIESFNDGPTSIIKTTDYGESWIEMVVDSIELDIQGIGFINENKGWVGPRNSPLYETSDGGQTWKQIDVMPNINRFFRINEDVLFASGSQVYKYGENVTGIIGHEYFRHAHEIEIIYPNPFSDQLTIEVRIDHRTNARIDLLSMEGQGLKSVYAGRLDAGIHEFVLNNRDLELIPAGMYNVLLRTNEGFLTKAGVKK